MNWYFYILVLLVGSIVVELFDDVLDLFDESLVAVLHQYLKDLDHA
jgi:hypothetical protein